MRIGRTLEHTWAALADLPTLLLKVQNRRLVSFRFCSALRQFARGSSAGEIRHIIDVGANEGQFAFMARYCWPAARIESFEPDPSAAHQFRQNHCGDSKIQLNECALGSLSGFVDLRLGTSSAQNSVCVEVGKNSRGTVRVKTDRLDESCHVEPNANALLKIDVQGYELPVLAGAERLLPLLRYVLIEVSLADLFEGGSKLEDVWRFMRERGFTYHGILDMYHEPATGVALQMDVIFARAS